MSLPQPDDLTSLVVRTDFSSDVAWEAVRAAVDSCDEYPQATYVSDRTYAGATVSALVDVDAAAAEEHKVAYLFLADEVTMAHTEHPLLAVDLYDEPGRTFRVPPLYFADISANLSISNMDFADFADAVDAAGVYRGFGKD
ncbi:DUF6924 domain-containing protein [Kibdelosporangium lantanae]|uniref:DUF6924 domain-containing protein n=1 Tax=Kibdelosporangium lantanae TaxID=1497396 RepID=A0ABW3M695_9PSEU